MPNPQNVPIIANGVLVLVVGACAALLLGAPVEEVLSVTENPVSRVAVITFAMSLVGLCALSFAMHLLLHRHRRMEAELAEARKLIEAGHVRFSALSATADALEARVDSVLDEVSQEMAAERERMRAQARAYLVQARDAKQPVFEPIKRGTNGGDQR